MNPISCPVCGTVLAKINDGVLHVSATNINPPYSFSSEGIAAAHFSCEHTIGSIVVAHGKATFQMSGICQDAPSVGPVDYWIGTGMYSLRTDNPAGQSVREAELPASSIDTPYCPTVADIGNWVSAGELVDMDVLPPEFISEHAPPPAPGVYRVTSISGAGDGFQVPHDATHTTCG